ncbi:unnamed protein product [Soboliphyme baturini]|uniref:RTP1_C1 domain-containing protein n=1 Tax=Soboliphyme baturini TaxID=241478 RepID=A0A183IPX6_9BILA|nr:unnamed protein product [Soboliphyme baturini]
MRPDIGIQLSRCLYVAHGIEKTVVKDTTYFKQGMELLMIGFHNRVMSQCCIKFTYVIMAGLMQLIHCKEEDLSGNSYESNLDDIISSSYKPKIIYDLLLLAKPWKNMPPPPQWLVAMCGGYMTQILLKPNGLHYIFQGFLDFCGTLDCPQVLNGIFSVIKKLPASYRDKREEYIRYILVSGIQLLKSENLSDRLIKPIALLMKEFYAMDSDLFKFELLESFQMTSLTKRQKLPLSLTTADIDGFRLLKRLYLSEPQDRHFIHSMESFARSIFTASCRYGSDSHKDLQLSELLAVWLRCTEIHHGAQWLADVCLEYIEKYFVADPDVAVRILKDSSIEINDPKGGPFEVQKFLRAVTEGTLMTLSDSFVLEFFRLIYVEAERLRRLPKLKINEERRNEAVKFTVLVYIVCALWHEHTERFTDSSTFNVLLPVFLDSLVTEDTEGESDASRNEWLVGILRFALFMLCAAVEGQVVLSQNVRDRLLRVIPILSQKTWLPESKPAIDEYLKLLAAYVPQLLHLVEGQDLDSTRTCSVFDQSSESFASTSGESLSSDDRFRQYLNDLQQENAINKGHALIMIKLMVADRSIEFKQSICPAIRILIEQLTNDDSYVYLSAINAIAAVVLRCPDEILPCLLRESLKPEMDRMPMVRARLYEALAKIIRCDLKSTYVARIINSSLTAFQCGDDAVKTSCLCIIAEMAKLVGFDLVGCLEEVLYIVQETLLCSKDIMLRRAAASTLAMIADGAAKCDITDSVNQASLVILRRLLQSLLDTDDDSVIALFSSMGLRSLKDIVLGGGN